MLINNLFIVLLQGFKDTFHFFVHTKIGWIKIKINSENYSNEFKISFISKFTMNIIAKNWKRYQKCKSTGLILSV